MADKITPELQRQLRVGPGLFRVSIRVSSSKLDDLVRVNRYEGMSSERLLAISEETRRTLAPIGECLDSYGLVSGKTYVSNEDIRNVSALLTREQVADLSSQDYVGIIDVNIQRGLPF